MNAEKASVSVVISTKNEERTIAEVIESVKKYADEVIVVDGHSTDNTRQIATSLGTRVILDGGKGKGDAVKTAIKRLEADILVFMDGDGSHNAKDIPELVETIKREEADLVVGSRILGGSDEAMITLEHLIRYIGSQMVAFVIALTFGEKITDVENGFRAIKREKFASLNLRANDFTIEQEMIIRALRSGLRIAEVPSHEFARKGGVSKLRTIEGWKFVVGLFRALWF